MINRKLSAFAAIMVLCLSGIGSMNSPARAADCPYPVTNPTSNDNPKANIRLVSPTLTDSNSIRRYDFESQFTLDCDWFGVGMRFNQVYVPFGLNSVLTYQATTPAGAPLVNQKVTLRANKGYSGSNANIRVNGIKARPAPSNASDGASVTSYTDLNGMVSFHITSPDNCEAYGGTLPAAPLRLDSDTPNDRNADPTTDCFSQLLPSIYGEKLDSADWIELHYFNSSAMNYSVDNVDIKLLAPLLDDANSIQGDGVVQAYVPIATKQVLAFQALKPNGTWARNVDVQVRINLANSGANAKVSAGLVGNSAFGSSTVLTQADATRATEDQLILTGKTDAFGIVTFHLSNFDTIAPSTPATKTTPVPTEGAIFAKVFAEVVDKPSIGSALELHYFNPFAIPSQPTGVQIFNLPKDGAGFVRVQVAHEYKPYEGVLKFVVYDVETGENICEISWNSDRLGCISGNAVYGSLYRFGVYAVNQVGRSPSVLSNIYEYKICSSGKTRLSASFLKDALPSGSTVSFSGQWHNHCTKPAEVVEYREKTWDKAWSTWVAIPMQGGDSFKLNKPVDVNTAIQFRGLLENRHFLSPVLRIRVVSKVARPISIEAIKATQETPTNLGRAVKISFNGDQLFTGLCTATASTAKGRNLLGRLVGTEIKSLTFRVLDGLGFAQIPVTFLGTYKISVVCRDPNFQDLREFGVLNLK